MGLFMFHLRFSGCGFQGRGRFGVVPGDPAEDELITRL